MATDGASNSSDSNSLNGTSSKNNGGKHHKKANVGAIVGGVVGGVVGGCAAAIAALLIIRHVNLQREQERMEKEYQEAIKPVDYPDAEMFPSPYSSKRDPSSGSFDEELRNKAMYPPPTGSGSDPYDTTDYSAVPERQPSTNHLTAANPFDDSRRISNGSLLPDDQQMTGKNNVLTVVNPDETD